MTDLTTPDAPLVSSANQRASLSRLRLVGRLEGGTLLVLLFVAVPLKYLFQLPQAVSVMGPLHGLAFLAYMVVLIETVATGVFERRETWRTLLACFVPFGPFLNDDLLRRKLRAERSNAL